MSILSSPKSLRNTTAVEANCACPVAVLAAKGKFVK
jgi:hypothetical protein